MERNENKTQMSVKEKIKILFWTLVGFGVGGVFGIIAYQQQWLG